LALWPTVTHHLLQMLSRLSCRIKLHCDPQYFLRIGLTLMFSHTYCLNIVNWRIIGQ